jgi:hypothetical protein
VYNREGKEGKDMMKMRIVLKDRIVGKYDRKETVEKLDRIFARYSIKRDGEFYLGGTGRDFEIFGGLYLYLKKEAWFTDNIKVWEEYDSEETDPGELWGTENLLDDEEIDEIRRGA